MFNVGMVNTRPTLASGAVASAVASLSHVIILQDLAHLELKGAREGAHMIGEIAGQTIHSSDHPVRPSQPRYPHHGPPQTHPGPCSHLPALYHVNKYTQQGSADAWRSPSLVLAPQTSLIVLFYLIHLHPHHTHSQSPLQLVYQPKVVSTTTPTDKPQSPSLNLQTHPRSTWRRRSPCESYGPLHLPPRASVQSTTLSISTFPTSDPKWTDTTLASWETTSTRRNLPPDTSLTGAFPSH